MASQQAPKKRPMEEMAGYEVADRVYRFKILLPNGTSVGLAVRDPEPRMEFWDFIKLIKDEYYASLRQNQFMKKRRPINWYSEKLLLEDANDKKTRTRINFENFKPLKCHIIRLHDGSGETMDTFENMWDLTPDTDLLMELPEEYTFETALADLMDNSLQAVWSNDKHGRRLIRVDVSEGRISIFDTGSGMDGSDENSIVKWGKIGASLHRSSKAQGIGGKPPYLMPCFGMFGYGGAIASMHLGRHALVSSKTKSSKKVYTLHLEREALLSQNNSGVTWRTDGSLRDPSEDEIGLSPQGSFTKVEILEPKMKSLDLYKLQCRLKDIYFPYIQCDEMCETGKTETPIEFQVGRLQLPTYILAMEMNLLFSFTFPLEKTIIQQAQALRHLKKQMLALGVFIFLLLRGKSVLRGFWKVWKLKDVEFQKTMKASVVFQFVGLVVYFQMLAGGWSVMLMFLRTKLAIQLFWGRMALLPFMDFKQKKGDKALILKRCCMRVKCFVETDAGFNPTPSKTDLAHHNLFTIALKNFGSKSFEKEKNSGSKSVEKEKDITIEVHRSGRQINPSQLEKEYQNWILQMHDDHDEEINSGEDEPVLVISPLNKKELGISSDVVRVHRIFKRKGLLWKYGQNIKVLKGACAGCWKNNVYATLEYFLIEGFQGDAGGEARIICRPLGVPDESGCILEVNDGNARLDIRNSLSFPISIIDCGKCCAIEKNEWVDRLEKQKQKAPSMIDLLNEKHCQELEFGGALSHDPVLAGQVPPSFVAVIRPGNFDSSGASKNLDQKFIIKSNFEMLLEVKFRREVKSQDDQHIYSGRSAPSSLKGFHGLYIFSLGCRFPKLFENAGVYTFTFSIPESGCETCVKHVLVKASSEVGEWKIINHEKNTSYSIQVGSSFPPCSIACYDIYGNRIHFTSTPSVIAKLITTNGLCIEIDKVKVKLSYDKSIVKIENILIHSNELDRIRPSYAATLVIYQEDELVSVSIPCEIVPGSLRHVIVWSPTLRNNLLPGCVISHLMLEMFDEYGNHIIEGSEVELNVDGFHIQGQIGRKHKVNDLGYVDLSGVLKVNVGYGKSASLIVLSDSKAIFKQEFQTETRKLMVASGVPESCVAGSHLENVVFEIVDSNDEVDGTIHYDEECNGAHTLTIKSESFNKNQLFQYAFIHGRCTVPFLPLPKNEGTICFEVSHSRHAELHLTVKIRVETAKTAELEPATNVSWHEYQSSCLYRKSLLLEDSSNGHAANVVSLMNNEKVLADGIEKYGLLIGKLENQLELLNGFKAKVEHEKGVLQDNLDCLCTRDEIIKRIENKGGTAAALFCCLLRRDIFEEPHICLMKNSFGLVALLGTVQSRELSRILAEYLGEDQLFAVVCRSSEAARELEYYNQDGEVNYNLGLHAEAAALGKSINDRFLVICLEDVRAYTGEFIRDDPQEKLALPDPTLPTGEILPGFMGYAVNMINIDAHHLKNTRTAANHGLRETLFYSLFGEVQVYETRKHMEVARAYINHGAVSLDGGILKPNGFVSLGVRNSKIYFPVQIHESPESTKISRQIKEKNVDLEKVNLKIQEVTNYHKKATKKFGKRKTKYLKLVGGIKPASVKSECES